MIEIADLIIRNISFVFALLIILCFTLAVSVGFDKEYAYSLFFVSLLYIFGQILGIWSNPESMWIVHAGVIFAAIALRYILQVQGALCDRILICLFVMFGTDTVQRHISDTPDDWQKFAWQSALNLILFVMIGFILVRCKDSHRMNRLKVNVKKSHG